jgi:hypothetical protein
MSSGAQNGRLSESKRSRYGYVLVFVVLGQPTLLKRQAKTSAVKLSV